MIRTITVWSCGPGGHSTRAKRHALTVEVARDADFRRVVATAHAPVLAAADWTCRVLVGGLLPATVYWYRFTDDERRRQPHRPHHHRPAHRATRVRVRFAFVSCKSVNEGAQNAYRRMIWEDERAPADRKLGFVLHLGDFIYEVVEYPDEVSHRYSTHRLRHWPHTRRSQGRQFPRADQRSPAIAMSIARISTIPTSRTRARYFPFVCIGDNHEFSWQGWQSFIKYDGKIEPAQPLRVAANQAWWEYIPSRVRKASGPGLDQFDPPAGDDARRSTRSTMMASATRPTTAPPSAA